MARWSKGQCIAVVITLGWVFASAAQACKCKTCHCGDGCSCGNPVVDAILNPQPPAPAPAPEPLGLTGADSPITLTAANVQVYVFDTEFSTDSSGATLVDPVIQVGDTITWVWVSGVHSVTSVTGSPETFNSGDRFGGPNFPHTFTHEGLFDYYCDLHGFDNGDGTAGGMAGQVTVLAVPEPVSVGMVAGVAVLVLRRRRY